MDADVKVRGPRRGGAEQDGEEERRVLSSQRTKHLDPRGDKGERNLGRRKRRNLPVQVLTQLVSFLLRRH